MFNAIAGALMLASRQENNLLTHHEELHRHEERKREELHRQQVSAQVYKRKSYNSAFI